MTALLVDTQVWLWLQVSPDRLAPPILEMMEDSNTELFFSAASGWEIAIKWELGKLDLPIHPSTYVPTRLRSQATQTMSIRLDHTLMVAELPDHHRDPVDRILVAQSRVEDLPIVTVDSAFNAYDIEVIRADT
jgi:PIN domain nuclease of toxin-antitoxin system